MYKIIVKFIILFLLIPKISLAGITGNEYLSLAQSKDVDQKYKSLYYIESFLDSITFQNIFYENLKAKEFLICIPSTVTKRQIMDMVEKDMVQNPDTRHYMAYTLIYTTLLRAWPCDKQ